ncbi:hypothetical protein OF83DRAFT_764483 [Amylostereum chailletii]|nr:hypothetical protein OF83DRAFT_764483 [Amylostereum chailletii]
MSQNANVHCDSELGRRLRDGCGCAEVRVSVQSTSFATRALCIHRLQLPIMPPPKSKGGKMLGLINWRLKVTINDGRALTGQMLAFDRHMNLVLADCEEFRRVRPKKKQGETEAGPEQEMKRTLGLVILRGESVVSLTVEGPPPVQDDDKKNVVRALFCVEIRIARDRVRTHGDPAVFFSGFAFGFVASSRSWTRYAGRPWDGHDASDGPSFPPASPHAVRTSRNARCTPRFPSPRLPRERTVPPSWLWGTSSRLPAASAVRAVDLCTIRRVRSIWTKRHQQRYDCFFHIEDGETEAVVRPASVKSMCVCGWIGEVEDG